MSVQDSRTCNINNKKFKHRNKTVKLQENKDEAEEKAARLSEKLILKKMTDWQLTSQLKQKKPANSEIISSNFLLQNKI